MLIAIDHGNKAIKTKNLTFTSGLLENDTKPPFGDEIIRIGSKYYSLSDRRIPYMRDKTADDRFLILTLFAIAGEIEVEEQYIPSSVIPIALAVGLPPNHYGALYKKFEQYFKNIGTTNFEYKMKTYYIHIENVMCFPQAIAAAWTVFGQIKGDPKVMVIDIGGYTVDYVQIKYGKADFAICDSLENGIIKFYNDVIKKVNADLDILLDESDIDAIIQGKNSGFPNTVQIVIHSIAAAFIGNLAGILRERGVDLRIGKTVFVGGGSILLRRYIDSCKNIGPHIFVEDIAANVKGYELMYRVQ
ncbi:MAG: ParM/StbA family protein [Clostridiales bacterium]|jgi:plasmid segregation protein ParM|nr:ParM/StbA family protein [Clostridiales bacterium]